MATLFDADEYLVLPVCKDCGIDAVEAGEWFMLRDDVWAQAAESDAVLCIGCVEVRLGRRLAPGDFLDVPLNQCRGSARMRSRLLGLDETKAG
jgi:hypothetical protein